MICFSCIIRLQRVEMSERVVWRLTFQKYPLHGFFYDRLYYYGR